MPASMTARSASSPASSRPSISRARATLPFGIDVLAFGDEEGSRFPATLASSSACAGVFETESARARRPQRRDARRRDQSLRQVDPAEIPAAAYAPRGGRRPMWRCTSSRGRCWRRARPAARRRHRHRRPDLAPRRQCSARPATPAPCRCCCGATRLPARPKMVLALRDDSRASTRGRAWSAPSAASRLRRAPSMSFPADVVFTVDMRSGSDRRAARKLRRTLRGRSRAHRRRRAARRCRIEPFA